MAADLAQRAALGRLKRGASSPGSGILRLHAAGLHCSVASDTQTPAGGAEFLLSLENFMRSLAKLALSAVLLAGASLNAQTLGNTSTYSGLTWAFSSGVAGLQSCGTLVLDATGDIQRSDNFAAYGQLFCPALGGGYASSGNAYFDSTNAFHMSVRIGVAYIMVCDYLNGATLSGSCPIYDNLGNQAGSAFVSFL